eukprot:2233973-Prymnesium_polylepis.1
MGAGGGSPQHHRPSYTCRGVSPPQSACRGGVTTSRGCKLVNIASSNPGGQADLPLSEADCAENCEKSCKG